MNSKRDDDSELFSEAMKGVTPLGPHNLVERNPQSYGRTSDRIASDNGETVADIESGFFRPGIQSSVLRRLRNGAIPIEDELDLHGLTALEAEHRLKLFLRSAQADRQRAVRIIHGKGLGSPEGRSVLKSRVAAWLRTSDAVLAFCAAGVKDGGSGAVHVLLKRNNSGSHV